jgi:hypothetical protein
MLRAPHPVDSSLDFAYSHEGNSPTRRVSMLADEIKSRLMNDGWITGECDECGEIDLSTTVANGLLTVNYCPSCNSMYGVINDDNISELCRVGIHSWYGSDLKRVSHARVALSNTAKSNSRLHG